MAQMRCSAVLAAAILVGLMAFQLDSQAGEAGGKKIVAGKTVYKPKGDNPAWAEKGRIVGLVRQCPGCTIQALDADGKEVVLSTTVAAKKTGYELEWLKPGTYVLRVTADGYTPLVVDGLVVKAKNDLQMNIEFEE